MKYLGYGCLVVLGIMVPPLGLVMLAIWFFVRHTMTKIETNDERLRLEHEATLAWLEHYRSTHTPAQWAAFKAESRAPHRNTPKDRNRERLIAIMDIEDRESRS